MPADTTTQGETPTTPATTETVTTTTPATNGETPPWGTDFNPERAWNTIQTLRTSEDELKRLKKEQADREKADKVAADQALSDQQEFQKLADERQKRIDELEPEAGKAERYEAELQAIYEVELAALTDEGREMVVDSGHTDMIDKLAYIRKHAAKLKPQQQRNGIEGTPPANSQMTDEQATAAEIQRQRSSGRYAF